MLLAGQRGDATLLILRKDGGLVECLSARDDQFATTGLADPAFTPELPAGAVVNLETMSSLGRR